MTVAIFIENQGAEPRMHLLKISAIVLALGPVVPAAAAPVSTCATDLKPIAGLTYLRSSTAPLPAKFVTCLKPLDAYVGWIDRTATSLKTTLLEKNRKSVACFDYHIPSVEDVRALQKMFNAKEKQAALDDLTKHKAEIKASAKTSPRRIRNKDDAVTQGYARMVQAQDNNNRLMLAMDENAVRLQDAYASFAACSAVFLIERDATR